VFGFHRAMDHGGAVAGPLIASLFLYFYPGEYRTLFALTLIPGAIVILILLRVPATHPGVVPGGQRGAPAPGPRAAPRSPRPAGEPLPPGFARAMGVILLFSLGNASDAFLLLRLSDIGVAAVFIPLLWSALHVVKSVASVVGGDLSDRFGRRRLIAAGWMVYAGVYAAFGLFSSPAAVIAAFLAYGVYFGATEGVEKAWVADLVPASRRGTSFGIYNAVLGGGSLAASLLFGVIWTRVSPAAAFYTGAALAVAATLLLYWLFPRYADAPHPGHE
jgi:predicted MFS family arabinose efflux permease